MTADLGTLLRVLNNNAVMVDTGGGRLILLGRGIGFGRQLGDRIELGVAHEIFSPSGPADLRQLTDFVTEIPIESFEVARRAVDLGTSTAGIHPSQALLLAIADHLVRPRRCFRDRGDDRVTESDSQRDLDQPGTRNQPRFDERRAFRHASALPLRTHRQRFSIRK